MPNGNRVTTGVCGEVYVAVQVDTHKRDVAVNGDVTCKGAVFQLLSGFDSDVTSGAQVFKGSTLYVRITRKDVVPLKGCVSCRRGISYNCTACLNVNISHLSVFKNSQGYGG